MTFRCTDNPKLGIVGCGAEWEGTAVAHCVAKCAPPWESGHPDGRCHESFSSNSAADKHWVGKKRSRTVAIHTHPSRVDGLVYQPQRGNSGNMVWTTPQRPL